MLKEKSCGGEMESSGVKRDFSFSCQVLILQEYNHVLLRRIKTLKLLKYIEIQWEEERMEERDIFQDSGVGQYYWEHWEKFLEVQGGGGIHCTHQPCRGSQLDEPCGLS